MSGSDAYEDAMRILSSIGDRDQDRVLAGRAEAVGDDLRELAVFCQEARALFVIAPSEPVAARHLAEIAAAARNPVAAAPVRVRRRTPFASLGTRLALAGAGVALLAAFAGGALAGVLPGAIQDKVAGIARNVGLSLPGSTHAPPIGTGNRPKPAPAKPSARLGGTEAEDTKPAQTGGDQTTQGENDQTTQSGGAPSTHGAGDEQTTQNEGSQPSRSASDGAAPRRGDPTTETGTEGSAPGSTDGSRQPSVSGSAPTSGGSPPESDSIPAGGGSPALPGDTPSGSDPAEPVSAAPASPGD